MKKILLSMLVPCALMAAAQTTDSIPTRAVIVSGDPTHPDHAANIEEMYSRINMAFEDPQAPRFLFLDKKGSVALGIGGYLKATGMFDFGGAVDNNGFYTDQIVVPNSPAQRHRIGATANHSSIFLKLVTRPTKLGRVIVYMQTNFTGNGGNYGLAVKQAYLSVGHVTVGKARSTFADAEAMAPTIDDQGPSGQVTAKNLLVKYASPSYSGFSYAVSLEMPVADYTLGAQTQAIAQRFPDIPAYIQYGWNKGNSHIRLSGIFRGLSYRNMVVPENKLVKGYGAQISAVTDIAGGLAFFGHYTLGKGIAHYINDLADLDLDLIPGASGTLVAPKMAGWTAGLQYTFNPRFFVSASYSRAQLYGHSGLPDTAYRYGQYIAANAFYNVWDDLRLGIEYLHGTRNNFDGQQGKANRFEVAVQYNF